MYNILPFWIDILNNIVLFVKVHKRIVWCISFLNLDDTAVGRASVQGCDIELD